MKPAVSYNAQKRCKKLTEFMEKKDEDSSVWGSSSEGQAEGQSHGKVCSNIHT